jgi:serine phosphatase RsbU (regulator of sigma subunit)
LCFYTDGATDSRDPEGAIFGLDRLEAVLSQYGELNPDHLRDRLVSEIVSFRDPRPADDDCTILIAGCN